MARPGREPGYSEKIELDLSTVVPSIAGPKRPQDRVALADAKAAFRDGAAGDYGQASWTTARPARSRPPTRRDAGDGTPGVHAARSAVDAGGRHDDDARPRLGRDRRDHLLHQHLQPVGHARRRPAGQEGRREGPERKPWVKTTLAPGSKVVMDYYERAGLTPYLDKLGFNLVGYGCTTCIGNSGPLPTAISAAVNEDDLAVVRCCPATGTSRAGSTRTSR